MFALCLFLVATTFFCSVYCHYEYADESGYVEVVNSSDKNPKPISKNTTAQDPYGLEGLEWDVLCKLQPIDYNCDGNRDFVEYRFYYDTESSACKTFKYSHCFSKNNFLTLDQCYKRCRDANVKKVPEFQEDSKVVCLLQPQFGDCHDYRPMYYFDMEVRDCRGFSYSGCGGNQNRFDSMTECSVRCSSTTISKLYKKHPTRSK